MEKRHIFLDSNVFYYYQEKLSNKVKNKRKDELTEKDKDETLNKRIRTAEKQKVPMILVLGDNEVSEKSVALRDRRARQQQNLSLDEFINFAQTKLNEVNF